MKFILFCVILSTVVASCHTFKTVEWAIKKWNGFWSDPLPSPIESIEPTLYLFKANENFTSDSVDRYCGSFNTMPKELNFNSGNIERNAFARKIFHNINGDNEIIIVTHGWSGKLCEWGRDGSSVWRSPLINNLMEAKVPFFLFLLKDFQDFRLIFRTNPT